MSAGGVSVLPLPPGAGVSAGGGVIGLFVDPDPLPPCPLFDANEQKIFNF
ncbi:hypothetical protein [Mycoplasmopsis pulmonis]|nr:hypothetical protein [Mycoplasmopsis pulmonis]